MEPYFFEYRVRVSDTDLMGVMHHRNYPRIFEWAREDFFRRAGHSFESHIERGQYHAVLAVSYRMRRPARHGQMLRVELGVANVTKVRLELTYDVTEAETGQKIATGTTEHTVLNDQGRVVRVPQTFFE